jgi:phosphoribosylglycinamide formyltransferase-1
MSGPRFGVLLSGSGSNFQAIADSLTGSGGPGEIAVVISNRRKALGLERARKLGITALHIPAKRDASRETYDTTVVNALQTHSVDWLILAGFMRIVTPTLLTAFPNRVLNIHPSLLPSFKGLHAQQQALDYGVALAGATVHLVTNELDAGPIIAQGTVPVYETDSVESLRQRILSIEHQLYPMVVRWICEGRLNTDGGTVQVQLEINESRSLFEALPS